MRPSTSSGFTLIELMAVVLFTTLALTVSVNFYLDLSRANRAAAERTREGRRAATLLDRVAGDLEAAFLVKKPGAMDPLEHPWVFLAEARDATEGADRLKFATRGRARRATQQHVSDLEQVAYFVEEGDWDGGVQLYRWSSPRLPESLDRTFPSPEDGDSVLLAEGLASFGVRLLGEDGDWRGDWDSSTLVDSSALPLAAEIAVAFLPDEESPHADASEPVRRRVLVRVRPLDLEAVREAGARGEEREEDEEGEEGCVTVRECVSRNPDVFGELLEGNPDLGATIDSIGDQCYETHAASLGLSVECD